MFNSATAGRQKDDNDGITLRTYTVPKDPEPELPRQKPKPGQIAYVAPTIVEDIQANNKTPDQDQINKGDVSTITTEGQPTEKPNTNITPPNDNNGNGETKQPEPDKPPVKIIQRGPQYPGGFDALGEFMQRNLVTPEEIEIGEKRIVKVRFVVGVDGSITDITVLESPGKIYDKEVIRVIRKMPHWEPAIQNDINVAVSFVLPVTFISEEL